MSAIIITGYTGTRHITPAMDAAIYRSAFGADSYILADGNQCAGSMPSINDFQVLSGICSMQGHAIQITQETLSVDTCATGYSRIDLVVLRFEHDSNTLVDSASLVVLKGTEVADPNTPVEPTYSTGTIDSGATQVDFPLYKIELAGATVTYSQLATVVNSSIYTLQTYVLDCGTISSLPATVTDSVITDDMVAIKAELGTPSAQTADWTVTTSSGSLTISGSISGSTTCTLYLNKSR